MATRDRKLLVNIPGLLAVAIWLLLAVAGVVLLIASLSDGTSWGGVGAAALLGLLLLIALNGFIVVQPNQAKVATFLGRYKGTIRRSGFHWINPLTVRRNLSLRIRNLDTDVLKVNDANGHPIEISAVITWQVSDAAQAAFDVEDYKAFVDIQAETAVRHVASVFPYDCYEEGQESLRGAAARQRIVEGAVGKVDHPHSTHSERDIVDQEQVRKAAQVSNLMVVLISDRGAQPVVNSGSLYT